MHDLFDLCDCDEQTTETTMPLIGDAAPSFSASTTNGAIKFPGDYAGKWIVFFSHPSDFTPVCTSEFIAFQRDLAEFEKLNTQLVGLSVGALSSHLAWLDAISKMPDGIDITFPLIDDMGGKIAKMYTIFTLGFFSFRYLPVPVMVPPVPMPATKMSTLPSVSAQISGPVVR